MRKHGLLKRHLFVNGRLKTAAGLVLILFCVTFSLFFVRKLLHPQEEAFRRQKTEEAFAEAYLDALLKEGPEDTPAAVKDTAGRSRAVYTFVPVLFEEDVSSIPFSAASYALRFASSGSLDSPAAFTDDVYYTLQGITFTPDYARGHIDCVLEYPSENVRIRRGVYTGTEEEIEHDLSVWMVTAARPDYVLGKTHYVIFGHNTDTQDLSFNRLKNACLGDVFTLTGTLGVFEYKVTKIAFLSREKAASDIVDDFGHPSSKCFILTCAGGAHSGEDLVVEGTLVRIRPLS